ncbi:MAG: sigma-54 specific flagellar transcriptional regulator A [Paracoccaceae bacterium]|jgi:sigma-54 specific flagellar transcriptional regulator A
MALQEPNSTQGAKARLTGEHFTKTAIVGSSQAVISMRQLISLVAPTSGSVLVLGPTGAGKELVAEAIHRESRRRGKLISLNCAAIPSELLESELFGYEKGAFTGADRQRLGRFEQAENGTLFLDEIGDLPLNLQTKLLRVLESRTVQRVGGREDIKLNFRLVCATHQFLAKKVEVGDFREDLFYRLNVFPIEVPSLADRSSDIPEILAALAAARQCEDAEIPAPDFDPSALHALCTYDWPGNVRELRNVVDRAFILFAGLDVSGRHVRENLLHMRVPDASQIDDQDVIWQEMDALEGLSDLEPVADLPKPEAYRTWFEHFDDIDLRRLIRDIEVVLIEAALEKHDGLVSRAAEVLKLRRTTLIEKMKKLMIERPTGPNL